MMVLLSPILRRAVKVFRDRGGMLRRSEVVAAGVHPRTLAALCEEGAVERISRGLYRLAEMAPLGNPDLVTVALRAPAGIVCLISSLAFHELTTQIPHEVQLAIARGAEPPRIEHPPVRIFHFSGEAFHAGIEVHKLDGVPVQIYGREKTIADCFRFRNKIGLDTCLESLRVYRGQPRFSIERLLEFARIRRVESVMRPYLEALL